MKLLASGSELHWLAYLSVGFAQHSCLSAGDATFVPIYGVSRTIMAPSLYIQPVQIIKSCGDDFSANIVDCLTLQILLAKTYL